MITPVYCCRCDTRFTRLVVRGKRQPKHAYPCPTCGGFDWSLRPIAEANELVTNNIRLIYMAMKKVSMTRQFVKQVGFEQLVAVGETALLKAAYRYDSSLAKFSTYAVVSITRRLWQFVQEEQDPTGGRGRLCGFGEDDEGIPCETYLLADDADHDAAEAHAILRDALHGLSEREQQVITDCIMNGETLAVVGDRLGITKERVRQIKNEALAQLRERLAILA